ncbi:hypothetical protein [Rhizobium binxianense]
MKLRFAFALVAASAANAFSPPVAAQSIELEQLCIRATQSFFLSQGVTFGAVQSYPELTPPGVRLSYSLNPAVDAKNMTDEIQCQFDVAQSEAVISLFCVSAVCYSEISAIAQQRRRFQEIRAILGRNPTPASRTTILPEG